MVISAGLRHAPKPDLAQNLEFELFKEGVFPLTKSGQDSPRGIYDDDLGRAGPNFEVVAAIAAIAEAFLAEALNQRLPLIFPCEVDQSITTHHIGKNPKVGSDFFGNDRITGST